MDDGDMDALFAIVPEGADTVIEVLDRQKGILALDRWRVFA
jgi:hypothetical protein